MLEVKVSPHEELIRNWLCLNESSSTNRLIVSRLHNELRRDWKQLTQILQFGKRSSTSERNSNWCSNNYSWIPHFYTRGQPSDFINKWSAWVQGR